MKLHSLRYRVPLAATLSLVTPGPRVAVGYLVLTQLCSAAQGWTLARDALDRVWLCCSFPLCPGGHSGVCSWLLDLWPHPYRVGLSVLLGSRCYCRKNPICNVCLCGVCV